MTRIKSLINRHPWAVPVGGVFIALCLAWLCSDSSVEPPNDIASSIDTYIPAGFVLVPISVQNSESLDAVFGKYGVVDLYQTRQDGSVSKAALVRAVKMLRAPKNPNQFGVLVPDEMVSQLVRQTEPFFVVVHRPDKTGMEFDKPLTQSRRTIVYDKED